ncbi:MAG: hypothetical protein KAI64_03005, partial [Thermoplasmata archaeon]|nr:hypothetical protein [Thermoplasmata archaeon]
MKKRIWDSFLEQLSGIPDINNSIAKAIVRAGYTTFESLRMASIDELCEVRGIEPALAWKIKSSADRIIADKEWGAEERDIEKDLEEMEFESARKKRGLEDEERALEVDEKVLAEMEELLRLEKREMEEDL